jgi:hypothetical protein
MKSRASRRVVAALAFFLPSAASFQYGSPQAGLPQRVLERAPLLRSSRGVRCAPAHRLSCQLDPPTIGAATATVPGAWDAAQLHFATIGHVLLALEGGPLADVKDYITGHPLQDAGVIAVTLFTGKKSEKCAP